MQNILIVEDDAYNNQIQGLSGWAWIYVYTGLFRQRGEIVNKESYTGNRKNVEKKNSTVTDMPFTSSTKSI